MLKSDENIKSSKYWAEEKNPANYLEKNYIVIR